MVTQLQDAKISIRLDTEGAEKALSDLEDRVKKDAENIKKQTDEVGGETALQRQERRKREARGGPAGQPGRGPSLPGMQLKAPDIEKIAVSVAGNLGAAAVGWIPIAGPVLGNLAKAGISVAVPALEFGVPFAMGAAEEIMGLDNLPDWVPGRDTAIKETRDWVTGKLTEMSGKISALRAKQAGLDAMFDSTGDVIRTQLGAGKTLDPEFLKQNAVDQFKIGEAKALLGAGMKKAMKYNMGEALGKMVRHGPGGG